MFLFLLLFFHPALCSSGLVVKDLPKKNIKVLQPVVKHAKSLVQKKKGNIPLVISVAGCSGVGKTHFAEELVELLKENGIKTALLHFDDFLDPDYKDPVEFHPRFRYQDAHDCMKAILKGEKAIIKPIWNKHKKSKKSPSKIKETFSIEGIDLIVAEGEFTLCSEKPYDFKKYTAFGIFVDAQDEDIIDWDWTRGRSIPEKTKNRFTKTRRPQLRKFRQYIEPARSKANYLVIKNQDHSSVLFQHA